MRTTDLRALLGDATLSTVVKAAEAMYEHRTAWRPDSQPWNLLDVRESGEYLDLAAVALAAVLPDLLADAWDEGAAHACADPYHPYGECEPPHVNPYRPTEGDPS